MTLRGKKIANINFCTTFLFLIQRKITFREISETISMHLLKTLINWCPLTTNILYEFSLLNLPVSLKKFWNHFGEKLTIEPRGATQNMNMVDLWSWNFCKHWLHVYKILYFANEYFFISGRDLMLNKNWIKI